MFYKSNNVVARATRKFSTQCELARDYRESRTTNTTALTTKRALAPSRACSSSCSTLLFANACCNPTMYYSALRKVAGNKLIKHQPISSLTQSVGLRFATFKVRNLKPLASEMGRHQSAQTCTRDQWWTRVSIMYGLFTSNLSSTQICILYLYKLICMINDYEALEDKTYVVVIDTRICRASDQGRLHSLHVLEVWQSRGQRSNLGAW